MIQSQIFDSSSEFTYESPMKKPFDRRLNTRSKCLGTPERKTKTPTKQTAHVLQAPKKSSDNTRHQIMRTSLDEFQHTQNTLFEQTILVSEKSSTNKRFESSQKSNPQLPSQLPQAKLLVDSPDCLSKFHSKHDRTQAFIKPSAGVQGNIGTPVKALTEKSLFLTSKNKSHSFRSENFRSIGLTSPDSVSESISPVEATYENKENLPIETNNASSSLSTTIKSAVLFASPREQFKRTTSRVAMETSTYTQRRPDHAKPTHLQNNPRNRRCHSIDTKTSPLSGSTSTPTRLKNNALEERLVECSPEKNDDDDLSKAKAMRASNCVKDSHDVSKVLSVTPKKINKSKSKLRRNKLRKKYSKYLLFKIIILRCSVWFNAATINGGE